MRDFETWFKKVNLFLLNAGVTADDLPDCPYRDWFEDGVRPSAAANRAFKLAFSDMAD